MGKKVICFIQAFDCEKTIGAAMESILNQTYENWLCFVLSNGNENKTTEPNCTFDIIRAVAARDRRFIVMNKKRNHPGMILYMLSYFAQCFPESYICCLDGDDEYEPNFFDRSVAWAEEQELDIVACGTKIIQKVRPGDTDGILVRRRQLEENLIVRGKDFADLFPIYKTFFNELWGKIYRANVFRERVNHREIDKNCKNVFLPDTVYALDRLRESRAIGVLSGTYHCYFLYEQRKAHNATAMTNVVAVYLEQKRFWDQNGRYSPYRTYENVMNFLRSRGGVHEDVQEYMWAVLLGWLGDIYNKSLLPLQDEKAYAGLVSYLIFHPKFDELMCYQGSGKYNNLRDYRQRMEFCERLCYTLLAQKRVRNRRILWRNDLPCTHTTRRQLDRCIAKLRGTLEMLSQLEVQHDAE